MKGISANKLGWMINILLVLAFFVIGLNHAAAEGGKNRFGDDAIDEVFQLCQGVDEGTIEYEVCTGPEDGNCIVVRVDCSQDDEGEDE